jgi:DNA-binding NtrC family response regulator
VRVLTATNRDLDAMVAARTFREDLYFRLSSLTIKLPPLRERRDDLPALAAWFLERAAVESGTRPRRLTTAALRRLTEHAWPGNVRELENVLRASALLAETEDLGPEDLQGLPDVTRVTMVPSQPGIPPPPPSPTVNEVDLVYRRIRAGGVALFDMRREIERGCIAQALEESGGNITRAATLLGMKRPRLSQLVREYGLAKGGTPEDNTES